MQTSTVQLDQVQRPCLTDLAGDRSLNAYHIELSLRVCYAGWRQAEIIVLALV